MIINDYIKDVRDKYKYPENILNALNKALTDVDLSAIDNLNKEEISIVLAHVIDFSIRLYETKNRAAKLYARQFFILSVKKLLELKQYQVVFHVLEKMHEYDYGGWELCLIYVDNNIRNSYLKAKKISYEIKNAILGVLTGIGIAILYIIFDNFIK